MDDDDDDLGPRSRFWTYSREQWQPEHRWLHPGYSWRFFGSDEWDRWTIVLPIPFSGYLVTALFECGECRRGNEEHGNINIVQSLLAYLKKTVR